MNIQIFGRSKCFESKAAERFFKERKIKYQYIDLDKKGMSKGEIDSIIASVKDVNLMFDKKCPLYDSLCVQYQMRSVDDKKQLLLDNPKLIVSPILRDCDSKNAAVGKDWKTIVK